MKPLAAWFDCPSGISGDMCLGALLDAGASFGALRRGLKGLPVKGYGLERRKVSRSGLAATKLDVVIKAPSRAPALKWKEVRGILKASTLPAGIKKKGLEIFGALFEAEGKVHGKAMGRVHLHEMGAVDIFVDVIGTLICLEDLGVAEVCASPLNLGGGAVETTHGLLPVPAPATAELVKGLPVYSSGTPYELTTPTGAAIIRGLASSFSGMPPMRVGRVGYGAGARDTEGAPNVLRVFIGEAGAGGEGGGRAATVVEANIDDMNPQAYPYVMDKLLDLGAMDVFLTPVIMKKGRPGVLLTVLCPEEKRAAVAEAIFRETTTIGLRHYTVGRDVLSRRIREADTPFGRIRIKEASLGGEAVRATPEYEDCKRAAGKHGVPLLKVMAEAVRAAGRGGDKAGKNRRRQAGRPGR